MLHKSFDELLSEPPTRTNGERARISVLATLLAEEVERQASWLQVALAPKNVREDEPTAEELRIFKRNLDKVSLVDEKWAKAYRAAVEAGTESTLRENYKPDAEVAELSDQVAKHMKAMAQEGRQ